MMRRRLCGALLASLIAMACRPAQAEALPDGFVALNDIAPAIVEDMRYAGARNFTGKPLPGYEAARCLLRKPVAQALANVQAALAKDGLALKVYDCYRPARAVRAMHDWVTAAETQTTTNPHLPEVRRADLVRLGYIARRSGHSLGTAVDLTIVRTGGPEATSPLARPCTDGPDDSSIDMGTAFDCFDPKSATVSDAVTAEQEQWRRRLAHEMSRQGFKSYRREWWHFSFPRAETGLEPADFPIAP